MTIVAILKVVSAPIYCLVLNDIQPVYSTISFIWWDTDCWTWIEWSISNVSYQTASSLARNCEGKYLHFWDVEMLRCPTTLRVVRRTFWTRCNGRAWDSTLSRSRPSPPSSSAAWKSSSRSWTRWVKLHFCLVVIHSLINYLDWNFSCANIYW